MDIPDPSTPTVALNSTVTSKPFVGTLASYKNYHLPTIPVPTDK